MKNIDSLKSLTSAHLVLSIISKTLYYIFIGLTLCISLTILGTIIFNETPIAIPLYFPIPLFITVSAKLGIDSSIDTIEKRIRLLLPFHLTN